MYSNNWKTTTDKWNENKYQYYDIITLFVIISLCKILNVAIKIITIISNTNKYSFSLGLINTIRPNSQPTWYDIPFVIRTGRKIIFKRQRNAFLIMNG